MVGYRFVKNVNTDIRVSLTSKYQDIPCSRSETLERLAETNVLQESLIQVRGQRHSIVPDLQFPNILF